MFIPGVGEIKHTGSRHSIPPGAILLSLDDVKEHQRMIVTNWKPQSDVFMLKYGHILAGFCSLFSGLVTNSFFRTRFKLLGFGRVFTVVPATVMPAIGASLTNSVFIRDKILIGHYPCTICAEVRSGVYQVINSVLYTSIISPLMCATFARQHMTYPIPSLKDPNGLVRLVKTTTPSFMPTLGFLLGVNFLVGSLIAAVQLKQYHENVMPQLDYKSEFNDDSGSMVLD